MKNYREELSQLRVAVENDIFAIFRERREVRFDVSETGLSVGTDEDGVINVNKIDYEYVGEGFEITLTLEDGSTVLVSDCNTDDMISVYEELSTLPVIPN